MPQMIPHYINGRPVDGQSSRTSPVYNPATGEQTGILPLATETEVNEAVAAAQAAFPAWAATPPLRRARVLYKFRELLEANADRLAALITAEHGKVLDDARGEVT
ncbi:MAG TPA: aldehyde dehydrogenase family protein, partial [Candidatus Competibacteraceae bacterium]|nr:aldehyde dehydrogenase family protein [Candidatus Competibacteraceae bacterium]